jgi:hypothetical protein
VVCSCERKKDLTLDNIRKGSTCRECADERNRNLQKKNRTTFFIAVDICKENGFKLTWSEEEYNENGFLIKSRDILEESSGDMLTGNMLTTNKINLKKINNPEIKIIYNIITELSIVMGINIESQYEFIINMVTSVIKENLPNEENYKIKFKEAINKGKLMPSFKELYNSFLLYNTVGMFLISMQTHIPSIKTRKTYPGCIQSFNGYPFEGAGDLQSINYIACILYKLKTKEDPWSVLSRKKESSN